MGEKPDPRATPGLVSVRLHLSPELHERFRALAAESPERTMALLARRIVTKFIEGAEDSPRIDT